MISGLAVGIDGAAHAAALDAGGATIAVVGSGLDDPYPAAHRRLARAIRARGAVISELAPGVRATQGTFPRRNRIISALARATIVVEAPARSGALITARHALEQGRILLVAPGRPMDPAVAGNLALLRETPARPLVGLDEMIGGSGTGHGGGDRWHWASTTPLRGDCPGPARSTGTSCGAGTEQGTPDHRQPGASECPVAGRRRRCPDAAAAARLGARPGRHAAALGTTPGLGPLPVSSRVAP